MPTVYVDNPFLSEIRERKERMERKRDDVDYVSEKEILEMMLTDAAREAVRERRD